MSAAREALVAIGSNLGDRQGTLAGAVARLRASDGIAQLATSSIYETEPMGVTNQPKFLNAVIGLTTTLTPEELLRLLQAIEHEFGRERRERWGPRTLDLDLLAFENETRATPALELPHPRMFERAFVVVPLHELLRQPRYRAVSAWRDLFTQLGDGAPPDEIRKITPNCLG